MKTRNDQTAMNAAENPEAVESAEAAENAENAPAENAENAPAENAENAPAESAENAPAEAGNALEKKEIEYGDREELDAELGAAIAEILSAEQEAKGIIARAEASVKAIQLDGASRERDMRERSAESNSAARDRMIRDALKRAEDEREETISSAKKRGEALIAEKKKDIQKLIDELYSSLGGKA